MILTIHLVVAATQIATMGRTFPMSHPMKKIRSLHIGQIMLTIVIVISKTMTRKEVDLELSMVESRNRVQLVNEIEMIEIQKLNSKTSDRKIEKMIMDHVAKEEPMKRTNLET